MRALRMALRMLGREWRSGELGVLLLAVTVAVAALTGVGFLVERIGVAIDLQASEVLAADVRMGSPQPLPEQYLDEARSRGIRTARTTNLLSVVFFGEHSQLTNVRAVSEGYPLRGTVRIADEPFAKGGAGERSAHNRRGVAGLEAAGRHRRQARLPALDRHGQLPGRPGAHLAPGPGRDVLGSGAQPPHERGGPAFYGAHSAWQPRKLQPLFAGERNGLEIFKEWLETHKAAAERVRDISEASPQVKNSVDRAARFLTLASLVSVLLCAIAVAMCARRYVHKHLDSVALLKTLGATRAFTLNVSILQLLLIACLGALIGSGIGFVLQEWLLVVVRDLLNAELPPASAAPLAVGFMTAIAVLAGFALPPLLQLSRVPTLRVLRRDVGAPPLIVLLAFGPAGVAIAFLVYWVVRDVRCSPASSAG